MAATARREEDDARGAALRDARGPDQRAESHRCCSDRAVVQGPRAGARRVGGGYPLVNVYIANWKDPPFPMGQSTISMVIFNSKLLVYQRVSEEDWADCCFWR